jgi:hypothetical protein
MKNVIAATLLLATLVGYSQQPPGTEIILFDLTVKKNKVVLSNPENITNRKGYDNQPFFHPDQPLIYYASADESGRTDIHVYNYQTRSTQRLTSTPEREYSPTVTPDKRFISCIIQRENGAQDLGKYSLNGGEPEIIINNLTVGYHAWIDASNIVVFVLGQPNSLRWFSVSDKNDRLVAENIGRSLHRIPELNAISFVDKQSSEWTIMKLNATDRSVELIAPTLSGREDLAWTPDRKILMSDGEKILFRAMSKGKSWIPVELISSLQIQGITRMAVNTTGDKIAVVVSE